MEKKPKHHTMTVIIDNTFTDLAVSEAPENGNIWVDYENRI